MSAGLRGLAEACAELDEHIEDISIKRTHSFGETCLVVDVTYDGMSGLIDFSEITDEEEQKGKSPRVYTPREIVGRVRRLLSC